MEVAKNTEAQKTTSLVWWFVVSLVSKLGVLQVHFSLVAWCVGPQCQYHIHHTTMVDRQLLSSGSLTKSIPEVPELDDKAGRFAAAE